MHRARFVLLAVPFLLLTAFAFAQYSTAPDGPGIDQLCKECGVVYEIRELSSERDIGSTPGNSPFQDERSPPARPMITIPLTSKPESNVPTFDVYGTRSMRKQLQEYSYEIVIRYDDGRFTRREVQDTADLYVGARVRVYRNRIEPYDSE